MKKKKLQNTQTSFAENDDRAAYPVIDSQTAAGKPYFEVAEAVRNNSTERAGYKLTEAQKRLLEVQGVAIDLLLRAHNSMIELAAVRLECKLSNTRVSGVAKELKELIKVMSVYDC